MKSPKLKALDMEGNEVEIRPFYACRQNLVQILKIDLHCQQLRCHDNNLVSLPSELPFNLHFLRCHNNKIQKLPDLTQCTKLMFVHCDLKNFELYMLDMENIWFDFYY